MPPRPEPVLNESLFIVTSTPLNILNECPTRYKVIPHAPRPHKDGQLSFPLSLDEAWLAYTASKEIKPRALYSDVHYDLRLRFLGAPNAVPEASDTATHKQMSNAKHRCINDDDIKGTRIFCKPTGDSTAVHARLGRRSSSFTWASPRNTLLG